MREGRLEVKKGNWRITNSTDDQIHKILVYLLELMSDLILNLDADPTTIVPSKLHRRQLTTTPGSWTQRLKQKRQFKRLEKRQAKLSSHHHEIPPGSHHLTIPPVDHPSGFEPPARPPKRPKLDPKNPPKSTPRFQIISSLFSSTIIPTIKPASDDHQSSMVVYAPSNASLSEIELSSPSLNLHPQISHHLSLNSKLGPIKSPTAIQSIAWPLLSSHSDTTTRDVIIQSETGSGKTLAYLVPIVQDLLSLANNHPEIDWNREVGTLAIILVPTRELAEQVYHVALNLLSFTTRSEPNPQNAADQPLTEHHSNVDALNPRWLVPGTLHGGTNRTHEKARLRRGLPLLVCTPGRLLDHLEKTVSLRMAGEPISSTRAEASKIKTVPPQGEGLNLRWLVVDEADRLMDMGFEEQMRGILKHLAERQTRTNQTEEPSMSDRRTILCSATMPDGVKKLVGLSLKDPILLKATLPRPNQDQANLDPGKSSTPSGNGGFSAPAQLSQYYVITPPKLRLVSLIGLLRRITDPKHKKPADKVLVFMSCTASVDFHFEAIGGILSTDEEEKKSTKRGSEVKGSSESSGSIVRKSRFLPGVDLFRLHGNLDLQTRLTSLNAFSSISSSESSTGSSVLLCTSLAGRGLDVPFVSHVIQYDLPTEGGVTEYLHRIGRTARAGQAGEAWSFLLPSESDWVEWCEGQQRDPNLNLKNPKRLKEVGVQTVLNDGFGGKSQKEWEARATENQMMIERWVIEHDENRNLALMAFSSHIRAYATHPSQEKQFFHVKNLHLGHLAKSFGLREPPKNISSIQAHRPKTGSKPNESQRRAEEHGRKSSKGEVPGLEEDRVDDDDDDEDSDHRRFDNRPGRPKFVSLTRAQPNKHGNSLRGPMSNSIDEFNLG